MADGGAGDPKSPQVLLHKLCAKITGLKDDALIPSYQIALTTLGSTIANPAENNEFEIGEKIKKKLIRQGRDAVAVEFSELHRKLQSQELLKNRGAVLYLLSKLGEDQSRQKKNTADLAFFQGLSSNATSTPHWGRTPQPPGDATTLQSTTLSSGLPSGYSSIHGTDSRGPTPLTQSLHPSQFATPAARQSVHNRPPSTGSRLARAVDRNQTGASEMTSVSRGQRSTILTSNAARSSASKKSGENTMHELPESVLLRELVYVFQGIEGRYIKYDATREGFRVDSKVGVSKAVRNRVAKLAECGWLYNKIRKYADSRSTDRAFGLVGQSFCASLHEQLTEYYRLLAMLDSQLQQEEDLGLSMPSGSSLTLRKLVVWMSDPLIRLKALAALVDVCQAKKGGALASAVHSYTQHGDPSIRELVKHALTLVAQPIFSTVVRWIYDGELEDTYHEFFVASDPTVKDEQLWHDKYSLRKSMIPSFLNMDQARKILLTGKSINFLRQVCHDRATIRCRDVVKAAETHQVESIFTQDLEGSFQKMIDAVYKETSRHLLEVFHQKYKFMDHLKAMRRYLLLGQGDFIRHLMDLLEEDLAKPAGTLFLHNLTGILETAIRATNAQYDDADILKRLDVRLLEVSPGDIGWDVFSLDYHVDGPIRTVFTQQSMMLYLRVFNFLWRAKRMEYTLAGIWKGHMTNARLLRSIPDLEPVLHQCHMISSQMVHFVQQVQYYINFEVLECSWDNLLRKVQEAEDLDHIIAAHQEFQDTITTRSLLDSQSSVILTQLRTIFDLIIQFQAIQDGMYQEATSELAARHRYEERIRRSSKEGEWGVTKREEEAEERRRAEFKKTILSSTKPQLRVLQQSYLNMVQQFLVMLNTHPDVSLRFLSFRLDFNEHYKAREPKLRSPHARAKPRIKAT